MYVDREKLKWRPLGSVAPDQLVEARLQVHHAVQWLARFARAYVPTQPDDAHTGLRWDEMLGGLATQPVQGGAFKSLRIEDLALMLHDMQTQSLSLAGNTDKEVRQWLRQHLRDLDVDLQALDAPPPYGIPARTGVGDAVYDPARCMKSLTELAAWLGNAAMLLEQVRQDLADRGFTPSPVRCWPHHFDIASLTIIDGGDGSDRYIGVGFSPGDDYYAQPYFYVSVYPSPQSDALPSLSDPGHWHTRDFTAAVLTGEKIVVATDQPAVAAAFLQNAVSVALLLLR